MRFEYVLDRVAQSPFAASIWGDVMRAFLDLAAGVGHGDGKAAILHWREVDHIIAHEGGSAGVDSFLVDDFTESGELIGNALVDVFQPEVPRPERHRLGIAAGDEPGLETSDPCERYSRAVMSAKAFGLHHYPLRALTGDGEDVELAVRENAIDIKEQESDLASAADGR